MGRRFQTLSAMGALLTLNGLRPLPGSNPLSVPSFFGGWLTSELAPHNLAITVGGTTSYLAARRGRLDRGDGLALALDGLSVAGLVWMIRQGMRPPRSSSGRSPRGWRTTTSHASTRRRRRPTWRLPGDRCSCPGTSSTPRQADPRRALRRPDAVGPRAARRLHLDVYRPREAGGGRPVLIQVHGGGWVIGKKDEQGLPLMTHLAARGWVCVAPNYPLSPKATWPEHLVALKQALAWTREHIAEYGGDPSFIAVTGGSAGRAPRRAASR